MAESAINIAAVVLDQSAADKQRHLPRAEICISDGPKIRYTAEGRDLGLRCSKYWGTSTAEMLVCKCEGGLLDVVLINSVSTVDCGGPLARSLHWVLD